MRITHCGLGLGKLATPLVIIFSCGLTAFAGTNQVVMFTGFLSFPGTGTGMDILNSELATLGIADYEGMVFEWSDQQGAFAWVQQLEADRSTLVLIGHSFGGNGALQLAGEYLLPNSVDVDLTIQIDSVSNPNPGSNSQLPANVDVGFNYYQNSTIFFEPQGEDFVQGATNINTEVLFNDTSITHTSIDNDPRLHALIGQHIMDNLNQQNADFDANGFVSGADFRIWQTGFGTTGSATQNSGDANGDGNADDEDLVLWQQQYGNSAALGTTSVPEPSAFALVVGVTLGGLLVRHRKLRVE